MGGSGLPLVGAAEGAVAGLAALDPQTLSSAAGGREAVAEDQSATDRSAVAGDQDPEEEKDLWAHQTGLSAQAPHSGEDGSLGCRPPWFYGSGPGFSFRKFGQRRVCPHVERDRHSYHLDGVASRAGTRGRGRKTGSKRNCGSLALPLAGSGLRQRFGVHQLASAALVRAEGHTADTGTAVQERRQRTY